MREYSTALSKGIHPCIPIFGNFAKMSTGFNPRRIQGGATNLREVKEQDFCRGGCLDLQAWVPGNGGPVSFIQGLAVEID